MMWEDGKCSPPHQRHTGALCDWDWDWDWGTGTGETKQRENERQAQSAAREVLVAWRGRGARMTKGDWLQAQRCRGAETGQADETIDGRMDGCG